MSTGSALRLAHHMSSSDPPTASPSSTTMISLVVVSPLQRQDTLNGPRVKLMVSTICFCSGRESYVNLNLHSGWISGVPDGCAESRALNTELVVRRSRMAVVGGGPGTEWPP